MVGFNTVTAIKDKNTVFGGGKRELRVKKIAEETLQLWAYKPCQLNMINNTADNSVNT